jgi:hypothetical protein
VGARVSNARLPLAETDVDRAHEADALERVRCRWRCDHAETTALGHAYDWRFYRHGQLVAVAEYKHRDVAMRPPTFPTIWVSCAKLDGLRQAAPVPGFFVFCAAREGSLWYLPLALCAATPAVTAQRVKPRASWYTYDTDTEPVHNVPASLWRTV